jgi:hypothetical protein
MDRRGSSNNNDSLSMKSSFISNYEFLDEIRPNYRGNQRVQEQLEKFLE